MIDEFFRVGPHGARQAPARHRAGRRPGAAARPRPVKTENTYSDPGRPVRVRAGGPTSRFVSSARPRPTSWPALLAGERPQTIALVLSHLPPQQAGGVLARLQADVAGRGRPPPGRPGRDGPGDSPRGGRGPAVAALAAGANAAPPGGRAAGRGRHPSGRRTARTGMQILDNLATHDHALAERLGPQPLAFDDLADAGRPRAGGGGSVGRAGACC